MRTDYLNPALYNKLYTVMTYENVLALRVSLETGLRVGDVLALSLFVVVIFAVDEHDNICILLDGTGFAEVG